MVVWGTQNKFSCKVYAEKVGRLVGDYNQQGEYGKMYALDGKAVRGMCKRDEEGNEYLLSVYDVEQCQYAP